MLSTLLSKVFSPNNSKGFFGAALGAIILAQQSEGPILELLSTSASSLPEIIGQAIAIGVGV